MNEIERKPVYNTPASSRYTVSNPDRKETLGSEVAASGITIGEKLEDGELFETKTDVLERFRDFGYPAATLKELELMFDADLSLIHI